MKYIETTREGKILILTISNPPHNYLPSNFFIDLDACRDEMLSEDVDAVVITGKGRVFSKGADLSELRSSGGGIDLETLTFGNEIFSRISKLTKPVIAAINGACLGGGLELALACHLRVCSEKSRMGLPELTAGVIPGLGGIERLVRLVGESKALEMILLGDMISASRAYELNLVSRIFPRKDFMQKVLLFVNTILSARKEALKEVLWLVDRLRPEKEGEHILETAGRFLGLIGGLKF